MNLPLKLVAAGTFFVFIALAQVFIFSSPTQAAIGDAGPPTGGGDYYTSNGYGWYSYNVNGSGPVAWSGGGPWSKVQEKCNEENAPRVDAFIVQKSPGGNSGQNAKVFRWTDATFPAGQPRTPWAGYKGNNGGNWLSASTASSHFNSVPNKGGYQFGVNVAWFCYNPTNFDLTPTISGTPDNTESAADVTLSNVNVNNGGSTASTTVQWRITSFKMNPGDNSIPVAGKGSAAPTAYYGHVDPKDIEVKIGTSAPTKTPSRTFSNSPRLTPLASYVPTQSIPDADVGTRFCWGLSVSPRRHDSSQWSYSAPFCVIVTKQPKINILGSDVLVGRGFSGDTVSAQSIIKTSVTKQKDQFETITATPDKFTGLWRTGVSNSGDPATATKLGENNVDPHWIIANVSGPSGLNHCQRGYNLSGTFTTMSSAGAQARTVREVGGMAGQATGPNSIVGNEVPRGVTDNAGGGVWSRVSPKARWIFQNLYGQNHSLKTCHDPTYPPHHTNESRMNTWVYKLKDGFTIAEDVDLNSVKLTIRGGVDNGARFVINGQYADSGYAYPGWGAGASMSTTNTQYLKHGTNTLSVYVRSNYSHTGLLIDEFTASGTVKVATSNEYGSWAEYAVSATGKVSGLASAAAYAGGVASSLSSECVKAILTIGNSADKNKCGATSTTLGSFDTKRAIPDIASRFPVSAAKGTLSGDVNLGTLGSQGVFKAGASNVINLKQSELAPGQWVVINAPDATVNIDGNQTYANQKRDGTPYTGTDQIPQLVVIAKRINIRSAVSVVDAWLIASKGEGVVNTCLDGNDSDTKALSSDDCANQLTVNGPVQAKHLFLRRTYGVGTGTTAGEPAEKFNLRSDAYMWAVNQASTTGRVQTVYTKELPPRF